MEKNYELRKFEIFMRFIKLFTKNVEKTEVFLLPIFILSAKFKGLSVELLCSLMTSFSLVVELVTTRYLSLLIALKWNIGFSSKNFPS